MAHEVRALVPNAARTHMLLIDGEAPRVDVDVDPWEVAEPLAALEATYGLRATILRFGVAGAPEPVVTLLELDAPLVTRDGEWAPLADVERARVLPAEARDELDAWIAEQQGAPPPDTRPRWAHPGWRAAAEEWVRSHAGVDAELSVVRHWSLSAVYKVRRAGPPLFFKAVFPLFAHEPALTRALAAAHPGSVPDVVATDDARGWLLVAEVDGAERDGVPEARWEDAVAALARIHRAWSERRDAVLALGARDRTAALVPDAERLTRVHGVDEGAARALVSCCERLADAPIPATLVHGDFHPMNCAVAGDDVVIFDWSDAAYATPLVDLVTAVRRDDEEHERRVVAAYAAARDDIDRDVLHEAWRDARVAAFVYHVVSYEEILARTEPRDRWFLGGVPQRLLARAVALL